MSRQTQRWAGVAVGVLLVTGLVWAGQPETPPNWAQVDRLAAWPCPSPTNVKGDWYDIPDFSASISTTGNPVVVSITLTTTTAGGSYWLSPVIDGVRQPEQLDWQAGGSDAVHFFRVYPLPQGPHTFGAALTCANDLLFLRGWITVYELPSVRR